MPCVLVQLVDCCPWMRYTEGWPSSSYFYLGLTIEPSLIPPPSGSPCRRAGEVHEWQMADDSRGGPFKDDKAGRPGLDLSLQPAAEGGMPKEIRVQQLQQEPAPEGAVESVPSSVHE